jgi:hypothetical protein
MESHLRRVSASPDSVGVEAHEDGAEHDSSDRAQDRSNSDRPEREDDRGRDDQTRHDADPDVGGYR